MPSQEVQRVRFPVLDSNGKAVILNRHLRLFILELFLIGFFVKGEKLLVVSGNKYS